MEVLEVNEVAALVFVCAALIVAVAAYMHPGNTERTRGWWQHFIIMLAFVTTAEIATNVEEFWPSDHPLSDMLNLLEHLFMAAASVWALVVAIRSLVQAYSRRADEEASHQ